MPTLNTLFADVLLMEERIKEVIRRAVLDTLISSDFLRDHRETAESIVAGLAQALTTQYRLMESEALKFARAVAGGEVVYGDGTGVTAGLEVFQQAAMMAVVKFDLDVDFNIEQMLRAGMTPDAIRAVVVDQWLRAETPGRPVAGLIAALAQAGASGVQRVANSTLLNAFANTEGLPNPEDTAWVWITVEDERVCPDCRPRHNQIKTLEEWRELGLPKSGFSVCGDRDRCIIMPAEYADEEIDMSAPVRFDRKTVIAIGERAKSLAGG